MSADTISCTVPGCRRRMSVATYRKRFRAEPGQWICAAHWSRLTKNEKRVWNRLKRLIRHYGYSDHFAARAERIWDGLIRRSAL